MHSTGFDWDFSDRNDPVLVTLCGEPERWGWVRAEISIRRLAAFCGLIIA
jgi:hypothetical protein